MIYEIECDSGYWLSEGSSPYLYCNTEEELVVPHCERGLMQSPFRFIQINRSQLTYQTVQ